MSHLPPGTLQKDAVEMDGFLTQVSRTTRNHKSDEQPAFSLASEPAKPKANTTSRTPDFQGSGTEEAVDVLKSQPGYETLLSVLHWIVAGTKGNGHSFNILRPGPQSAQLVHILVTEIVPNYWTVLKDASANQKGARDIDALCVCLSSITGLNAILAFIRALLQEAKKDPKSLKQSHASYNIGFMLDLLCVLLQPPEAVRELWQTICNTEDSQPKRRFLQHEFTALLAGGRIVSLAAEAEVVLQQADKLDRPCWVADGQKYVQWLGNAIVSWCQGAPDEGDGQLRVCAGLLARALKLGYSEVLIGLLFDRLLLYENRQSVLNVLLDGLPQTDQRKLVFSVLNLLATKHLTSSDTDTSADDYPTVWAAAGALKVLIGTSETRKTELVAWLTNVSGAGIGESCAIRRAALASLAHDKEAILSVLEKTLGLFGDQLYIRHSPMLQQEAHAQVLLLSAGYLHRLSPIKLTILLRSSTFLTTISSRIAASQNRAKFLGMVVGEALSGLIHTQEKRLDFHMEETKTEEALWYKSLVSVEDQVGPVSPLRTQEVSEKPPRNPTAPAAKPKEPKPQPSRPAATSGFIIEEVEDSDENGEEEDEGLVPYAKPDSDAEDSDDDPTLINRNKPKAPVYIRDLIAYFRKTEDYDRQKLALQTAPSLIRRKANYGTEVSSHAEELATLLVGLEDKYELDGFHDHRLQGMVAVVVAQPQKMGRWFAKTFFDGDYSLSQRASILVVLGLSGREIAGFETSDYAAAAAFPSKQLPEAVAKHYAPLPDHPNRALGAAAAAGDLQALPPNALDTITQSLSQTFLAPLAANAADAASGPDVLKLASFTSRLQKQPDGTAARPRPRGVRAIPNTTATLLGTAFFFPLTSRFPGAGAAARGGAAALLLADPPLLALYLRTLALLLHAAGPGTLALPQMTAEFWDLLLSARARCVGAVGVAGAVLFGLMALLDVHEADMRGLCERHGREVVETVEWVSAVFDATRGGDQGGDGEENEVKMMAAGVLIRLREAVERYRALLMGDMIGFT